MGLLYADILVSRQNQLMWAWAKYLILIPARITLSPRPTCSSTTENASLSPSVRSKNVMQLERAPNGGSFKLGKKKKVMQLALVAYGRIAYATQQR